MWQQNYLSNNNPYQYFIHNRNEPVQWAKSIGFCRLKTAKRRNKRPMLLSKLGICIGSKQETLLIGNNVNYFRPGSTHYRRLPTGLTHLTLTHRWHFHVRQSWQVTSIVLDPVGLSWTIVNHRETSIHQLTLIFHKTQTQFS